LAARSGQPIHAIGFVARWRRERKALRESALFNRHLLHRLGLNADPAHAEAAQAVPAMRRLAEHADGWDAGGLYEKFSVWAEK
jgi:hypothetical protein